MERARAFRLHVAGSFIGLLVVACIWATSEYHNAGGWPERFSQSSGTPGTWNDWIIYPLIAWILFVCLRAFGVYYRRRPSQAEVEREMERIRRTHVAR